jgi:hypothetical protein
MASLPNYVYCGILLLLHSCGIILLAKQCETIQGHSYGIIANFVIVASLPTYVYSGILPLLMGSVVA